MPERRDIILSITVDPWAALTTKVWADGLLAEYELDQVVKHWSDWIDGLIGWPMTFLAWASLIDKSRWWKVMRSWPNPFLPQQWGTQERGPGYRGLIDDDPSLYPEEYFPESPRTPFTLSAITRHRPVTTGPPLTWGITQVRGPAAVVYDISPRGEVTRSTLTLPDFRYKPSELPLDIDRTPDPGA